jgi:DNA-binding CsgD family transcriptional regulator
LAALINMIDGAVAVLTADGTIEVANPYLHQLTARREVVRIDNASKLCFCEAAVQTKYRAFLSQACLGHNPTTSPATFSSGSGSTRLTAVMAPFPAERGASAGEVAPGRALLVLCASDRKLCLDGSVLRLHYLLSAAETDIVLGLAAGRNVSEAAADLGISVTTARNQLAAAMTKMGVRRQAEVVSAVATLAPRLNVGKSG